MGAVIATEPQRIDTKRLKRGATWTLLGFGLGQVIRFCSSIVLIRWVFREEDFGVAALVFAFLQGLLNFGDLGVATAIVQNPDGHHSQFRSTAWTLQLLRSIVLAGIAFFAAPLVAAFYEQPLLTSLIRVASLAMLIGNVVPTTFYLANRNLHLGKVICIDIFTQVATAATNITWGLLDPRPHVLIWSAVLAVVLRHVLVRILLGNDDRPSWHPPSVRALFQFGKWACVSSLLTFATSQSDRLIFGALIPITTLGVYSTAANIIIIPGEVISRLAVGVLFPVLCQRFAEGSLDNSIFRRSRRPIQICAGIMLASLCGGGPAATGFLYPAAYSAAGWMVQVMAVGCWIGAVLDGPRMWLLISAGQIRWSTFASACKLIGLITLLPLGNHLFGFPGALIGYAAADLFKYAASVFGCARIGILDLRSDLVVTAWFVGSSLIAWFVHRSILDLTGSNLLTGFCVLFAVSLAWLPLAVPFLPRRSTRGQADGGGHA